jgi:hypothetical protein
MAVLTPAPKMQFFDINGDPLVGGKVYTYEAGTTTPLTTYTDNTGSSANPNPVILNARGEAAIWLGAGIYKFRLTDANDVELWTVDYIAAPISGVSPALSGNVTINTNSSDPALKITQTGFGLALRVQDSADPDATPFAIDSSGNVGIGTAAPLSALEIAPPGVFTGAWAYLPAGTTMMFVQTAAPTGWTKSTTHDNKALRVVSGTASSGGSVAFTSAFASQAVTGTNANYTLQVADIPSHTHTASVTDPGHTHTIDAYVQPTAGAGSIGTGVVLSPGAGLGQTTNTTGISVSNSSTGGGGGHTHTFTGTAINLAVQYVDVIIAVKD